ncbi:MAG: hypothetical protein NT062_31890, partial [Proteobacteria bacterium]|nr:hypothetical protein [Pseudomonadota bacterium]
MAEPNVRRVIKKKGGGHGHHGGAWKVAYADFVTAMMAFFMVMWLLASTDEKSRKEISRYFRTGILPVGDLAMNHAAQFAPSVIEVSGTPPPPGEESLDDAKTQAAASSAATVSAAKIKEKLDRLANFDGELKRVMKNVKVT